MMACIPYISAQATRRVRRGTHTSVYILDFQDLSHTFIASNLPTFEDPLIEMPSYRFEVRLCSVFVISLSCSARQTHISYISHGGPMLFMFRETTNVSYVSRGGAMLLMFTTSLLLWTLLFLCLRSWFAPLGASSLWDPNSIFKTFAHPTYSFHALPSCLPLLARASHSMCLATINISS